MFSLVNFEWDPDEVTGHLGFNPTRIVRKGQSFPPPRDPNYHAKYNIWSFKPQQPTEARPPHHVEVETVLRPFREALEPRLDKVATLPECGMKTLSIYVAPYSFTPSFSFDRDSLAFLARLGVPFKIDIQNYAPDDDAILEGPQA